MLMEKNKSKNSTSWEPVAGWYDEMFAGNDTYQAKVILPNLLRLVPPKGKRIIDIACGQGFFSKAFAEEGAAEVFGVDLSDELIRKARLNGQTVGQSDGVKGEKFGEPKNLRFEVAVADKIVSAKNDYFDAGLIILALQNIKEMSETLKEASRTLIKGGMLVIVLNHPCFRIPKASSWDYDEKQKVQYRRIDKYGRPFTVDIDMTPGINGANGMRGATESVPKSVSKSAPSAAAIFTKSFHRPLQDYFKALASAGFCVTGLEEWISHKKSEHGPRAEAEDSARKEFPLFLTIIARKLART